MPLAAPKYKTLQPGRTKISSKPPRIPAASLLLNGFQTRYSVFVAGAAGPSPFMIGLALDSTEMRFSPYTDSPGVRFLVMSRSSFPRATKTPG